MGGCDLFGFGFTTINGKAKRFVCLIVWCDCLSEGRAQNIMAKLTNPASRARLGTRTSDQQILLTDNLTTSGDNFRSSERHSLLQ